MDHEFLHNVLGAMSGRMRELSETRSDMGAEEVTVLAASLQFCMREVEEAWNWALDLKNRCKRLRQEVEQNEAMIDQLHLLMARWTDAQGMNGAIGPAAAQAADGSEPETALEAALAEMGRQMPAGGGA